ncbi:MAG: MBOAT family O-acyltransferase [Oscillospiraceae bacterium]
MLFNSVGFLIFFPIVLLGYYALPQKLRKYWLLAASYYFYMCWNAKYFVLILFATIITYFGSIAISKINEGSLENEKKTRYKKLVTAAVIMVALGVLFLFKYFNFFFAMLSKIFSIFGANVNIGLNLLLPVGISFYTFQSISYIIDVYRGDIKAERRFVNYALFVSFFPQLVAGPIERSGNLLPQLDNLKGFSYDDFTNGLKIMVYGFFQKLVLADRIAVLVNTVYNNSAEYKGAPVLVATVLFAVQIYCDFAGYSNIALGAARCMGIGLMRNFNTPYFSLSIKDFWRNWHISLSTWFKDYLFIPLGGSRKGFWRTNINLMIIFAVSGLWHGAAFHFVAWGLLHGAYQVVGNITKPYRDKGYQMLHISQTFLPVRIFKAVCTFVLVDFAWIFFRANSFGEIGNIIKSIFAPSGYSATAWDLSALGLNERDIGIIIIGIAVLFICSLLQRCGFGMAYINKLALPIRWALYIGGLFLVLAYGYYGPLAAPSQFVYFQF